MNRLARPITNRIRDTFNSRLRSIANSVHASLFLKDPTLTIRISSSFGLSTYSSCSSSKQPECTSSALDSHSNCSLPSHDFRNAIIDKICDNGAYVRLSIWEIDGPHSTTFHASWLWSNDPRRVMLPSGQRTCTPGQWSSVYGRPKIKDAKVIWGVEEIDVLKSDDDEDKIAVPGPTMKDCCHPLPTYGDHNPWLSTYMSTTNIGNSKRRPYLKIAWSIQTEHDSSNAESLFDLEWLARFRYDDEAREDRREKSEVRPINALRRSGAPLCYSLESYSSTSVDNHLGNRNCTHAEDGLIHINFHSIFNENDEIEEEGLFNLMHAVFCDGAAIVSKTPIPPFALLSESDQMQSADENVYPVAQIAKAMSGGSLSHGSLYGNIFHVRVGERNSNNVAYTSVPLCPHQDLAYYESPPGFQFLHCVGMGKDVSGGESTLVDALAAAYQLRELRPESFETLVKCPATFVKQRDGACMTYRRPHIVLAEEGCENKNSKSIFDREIVAVHWSPPFEGPVLLPENDVDCYYEAYADLEQIVDNSLTKSSGSDDLHQYANEFTWERKLAPGEVLVFNNRRMLHGRRGFSIPVGATGEDSQRHLIGCYTNIDDTISRYRVLLRERSRSFQTRILNACNGSNIIP